MSKRRRQRHNEGAEPAPETKSRRAKNAAGATEAKAKTKRGGSARAASKPIVEIDDSKFAGVKPFEGSRTTKRRREELPTDWPSKPSERDNFDWFPTGESAMDPTPIDPNASITVYVPNLDVSTGIGARSAVVGTRQANGLILVDFEDGRYHPAAFADLVGRAHDRHVTRYPTTARLQLNPNMLTAVGTYDPELGVVTIDDPERFSAWTGSSATRLVTSDGPTVRRRLWAEFLANRPDVAAVPALRRQFERAFHV